MSNVTREQAVKLEIKRLREDINSSKIVQTSPYINGKQWVQFPKDHLIQHIDNIEKYFNNQPQLSDDVKFRLVDNNEDFKEYDVIHNGIVIDTINEDSYALFQAQASEIEGQKAITKEVSDTAMETIHEMNNKLNAIREVVKRNGSYVMFAETQIYDIKQIIKENNNEEHIK